MWKPNRVVFKHRVHKMNLLRHRGDLANVIGTSDRELAHVEGELAVPPPLADWDSLVQALLQNSPEVAIALIGIQRAQSNLNKHAPSLKPNIDLSTRVQKDNVTGDTITSVEVGLPIPVFNRNQGAIQQAQAEITAADRDVDRVELDLQQRLARVHQRFVDAQLQVTRYRDVILPKSEESLRLVTKGYEVGGTILSKSSHRTADILSNIVAVS